MAGYEKQSRSVWEFKLTTLAPIDCVKQNTDPHNGGTQQLTLILARPETSSIFPRRAFRRLDFPQPTRPTMAVD